MRLLCNMSTLALLNLRQARRVVSRRDDVANVRTVVGERDYYTASVGERRTVASHVMLVERRVIAVDDLLH